LWDDVGYKGLVLLLDKVNDVCGRFVEAHGNS
jgi:hypothetical protein